MEQDTARFRLKELENYHDRNRRTRLQALLEGCNAMGAALQRSLSASNAGNTQVKITAQALELTDAVNEAKALIEKYGDHQAFLLM